MILKFQDDLMGPFMNYEFILNLLKHLRLHNVSNPRFFFIKTNMLQRKELKSRSHVVPEFFSEI